MKTTIPKFQVKPDFPLKVALQALGMTSMFDRNRADFGGISNATRLYVSDARHKAFIEVRTWNFGENCAK